MLKTNKNQVVILNTGALVLFEGRTMVESSLSTLYITYLFSIHMDNFAIRKKTEMQNVVS